MKNLSQKIIIANWKMNLDYKSSIILANKLFKNFNKKSIANKILVLPDFLPLAEIIKNFKSKKISYGAQDVSPFSLGAYTGEVSLESLKYLGCEYVLLGHSERREYFYDDKNIALKVENVIKKSDIIPIICVGESWSQRKTNKTWESIEVQLKTAFSKIKGLRGKTIIIAYEPVWAIGSGKVVSVSDALIVHKKIKDFISTKFKKSLPRELGVVYGGSLNLKNYKDFSKLSDISGLLVGGASLKISDFSKIINNF
jgi:triosephosphate isomerase (TIM)